MIPGSLNYNTLALNTPGKLISLNALRRMDDTWIIALQHASPQYPGTPKTLNALRRMNDPSIIELQQASDKYPREVRYSQCLIYTSRGLMIPTNITLRGQ